MKKAYGLIAICACFLFLQGCASGPGFQEAKGTFPPLGSEKGRIYIYRTTVLGAAVQPAVRLDGVQVGTAKSEGFFFADATPGSHFIETTTEVSRRLTFTLEPGQVRYVRLNVSMGFMVAHVYPELVDTAVGEKEIAGCKFTGSK